MKNILLMGLTDHEAAAVEIMIGMNWRDHRCITLKRELSLGKPIDVRDAGSPLSLSVARSVSVCGAVWPGSSTLTEPSALTVSESGWALAGTVMPGWIT